MKSDPDEDLLLSIAEEVMKCLSRYRFFEKLDDALSPIDSSQVPRKCSSSYEISEQILLALGFTPTDTADIFGVLKYKSAGCACEILFNVAESSRFRETYWRNRARQLGHEFSSFPKHD